jgi:ectoine hydroxylase-related dioxygenase (phytanoyl-CoA dioxygenase family)
MTAATEHRQEILENGFTIVKQVYSQSEIDSIISIIGKADTSKKTFRKSNNLFAIRQFLKEVPETIPFIFTENLRSVITQLFGSNFFVVKSIYFDKPGESNWFVSYHQDLTISVKEKSTVAGFGPWSVKENQYAVQPPLAILENNFTIRIHLDDTTAGNGALRVVPGSHLNGIYRPKNIDPIAIGWSKDREIVCDTPKAAIMIMRPLLLHASSRSTNHQKRRVIHIEFSSENLPSPLEWSELYVDN